MWESECEKTDLTDTPYQIQTIDMNDKKMEVETIFYKDRKCKEKVLVIENEVSIKISKEDQNSYLVDTELEYGSETIYDYTLLNQYNNWGFGFTEEFKVKGPFKIGEPKESNISDEKIFYTKFEIKDGKLLHS